MFMFSKRFLSFFAGLVATVALPCTRAFAQNVSIAYWSFNDAGTPTTMSQSVRDDLFSADGGVNRTSATMTTNFAVSDSTLSTAGVATFTGTTVNATLPSGGSLSAGQDLAMEGSGGTFNNGRYLQFGVPTTNLQDIVLTYATRGSSSGYNNVQFSYATDGVTFVNFGAVYDGTNTAYSTKTYDLSAIPAANNVSNLQMRLTFSGSSSVSGNNRFDNIQINGNAIAAPEAGTGVLFALPLVALGVVALRRRK